MKIKKILSIFLIPIMLLIFLISCEKVYKVTWANEDGKEIKSEILFYGTTPEYKGDEPTKAADAQNTYKFSGWSPEISAVTGDITYKATFAATVNNYKVTWANEDGKEIKSETLAYGTTPEYKGDVPTKAADNEHSYKFKGWNPEISAVSKDVTYTAVYDAISAYTINFANDDGTILKKLENVGHGSIPSYDGETPKKADTAEQSFLFVKWEPEISKAISDMTYKATYLPYSKTAKCAVLWKNYDGKVIGIATGDSYDAIKYSLELPTKPKDSQGEYVFKGWVLDNNKYQLSMDHREYVAEFVKKGFENFDIKYVPDYSIFNNKTKISAKAENPTFELEYLNITINDISAANINLYGSFSGLTITSIKKEAHKLTIATSGTVGEYGDGIIALSKDATSKNSIIVCKITPEGSKNEKEVINTSFDATITYIKDDEKTTQDKLYYGGSFEIKLKGCSFSKEFQTNIASILSIENKLLELFKIDEDTPSVYNVEITSITDNEIKGKYMLCILKEIKMNNIKITFNDVIKDKDGKEYKIFAKEGDSNSTISLVLSKEIRPDWDIDHLIQTKKIEAGKLIKSQTSNQKYEDLKSSITDYTFKKEEDNVLFGTLNKIVQIVSIGVGVYNGDFFNTKNTIMSLFGLDPSYEILERLKDIQDKLSNIESQITIVREELEGLKQQLVSLEEEALLNNYLSAYNSWNDFINNYYLTLANQVYAYNIFYYQYYYDYAIKTFNKIDSTDIKIKLFYDANGNLIIPNANESFGIFGEQIDFSKTKEISIYELTSTIAGIQSNTGHAYPNIENEIMMDLKNVSNLDDNTILDILKVLRFRAMTYYFTEEDRLISFINAFTNFSKVLTGTQTGATISTNTKPLDAFVIMLSTVYNFGFETEADINLMLIKLSSLYLSASKILEIANYVNPGEVAFSGYKKLFETVKNELSSTRFFHPNKGIVEGSLYTNEVYLYGIKSYVKFHLNTYAIFHYWTIGNGTEFTNITVNSTNKMFENTFTSLSSISPNAIQTMALKVKLYNKLNGTNYSFGEYLAHIGLITEEELTKLDGVIYKIEGLKDNLASYTYNKDKMVNYHTADKTYGTSDFASNYWRNFVLAGGAFSFANEKTYTGLLAMKTNPVANSIKDFAYVGNMNLDYDTTGNPNYYPSMGAAHLKGSTSAMWILFTLSQ